MSLKLYTVACRPAIDHDCKEIGIHGKELTRNNSGTVGSKVFCGGNESTHNNRRNFGNGVLYAVLYKEIYGTSSELSSDQVWRRVQIPPP
jgi:hypothetical protein